MAKSEEKVIKLIKSVIYIPRFTYLIPIFAETKKE